MTLNKLKFGDIILIKFPFTNFSGEKKRPALVLLGNNEKEIVVCRISGQEKESEFDIIINDWQQSGLKLPSIIRLDKLITIETSIIHKGIGKLKEQEIRVLKKYIKDKIDSIII